MLAGANALGRRVKVPDSQQPGFRFDYQRRIRPADCVRRVRIGLLGRHAALLEQVVRAVVQHVVERVGHDFGEDRFLEGSSVCVPQVFEKVLEVNACFAHVGILTPGTRPMSDARVRGRLGIRGYPAQGADLSLIPHRREK